MYPCKLHFVTVCYSVLDFPRGLQTLRAMYWKIAAVRERDVEIAMTVMENVGADSNQDSESLMPSPTHRYRDVKLVVAKDD